MILTEGVVPYLDNGQVQSLAEDLAQNDNFQYWVVDYFSPQVLRHMLTPRRRQEMRNAPFKFWPDDWFGFFKQYGWKVRTVRYLADESIRLRRAIPAPWWAKVLATLLRNKDLGNFRKSLGYVLLEPSRGV